VFASTIIDAGIFLVLAGLAVAIIMVARVARLVRASLPGIKVELGQVNRAVNHVGEGEPPLIQQVREIRGCVDSLSGSLKTEMDVVHGRLTTLERLFMGRNGDPVE